MSGLKKKVKPIEIGSKVFDWTVLAYAGEKGAGRNSYWTCQCQCGNIKDVVGSSLRNGQTHMCQRCTGKINGRAGVYVKDRNKPHLYIIKAGTAIKIGVSKNPERRIRDIQSDCPLPVEILYIGYNEGHEEEMWHIFYAHRKIHGEWFQF